MKIHGTESAKTRQTIRSWRGSVVATGVRQSPRVITGLMIAVIPLLPLNMAPAQDRQPERISAADGDFDETPDAKQRLEEIANIASKLFKESEKVQRERRPVAARRDSMLGEAVQARERIPKLQATSVVTERQIAYLEKQIQLAPGPLAKELKAQQTRLRSNLNTLSRRINADRKLIEERMTQINALSPQIASIEQRLLRLNEQMSECRKQWLAIRQPFEKYSRGDFEGLRRVLDDWLVLDGQWPEAHAWAALCSFELEDMDSALSYLEKAQRLHADLFSKKSSPQLEALAGLIRRKQPGQSVKADAALVNASRLADKNSDWETHFLLGRCYFERPEEAVRAKTHLQRALAIQPDCDCAKLWLARLQTTSRLDGVRDPSTGSASLEELWNKSGRSSWRLACFVADAYSASQRTEEAEEMRRLADKLVPMEHKHRLLRYANRMPE